LRYCPCVGLERLRYCPVHVAREIEVLTVRVTREIEVLSVPGLVCLTVTTTTLILLTVPL